MTYKARPFPLAKYESRKTNAVPVAFEDIAEGRASVRIFGVKGDGTTDDTTAIRNAILSKEPLYWPRGIYRVTGDIGAGNITHSDADLDWFGDQARIVLDVGTAIGRMARILIGGRDCRLQGIVFDGAHMTAQCLRIENNSASMDAANIGNLTIIDCEFSNARRLTGDDGGEALLIRGGFKSVQLYDVKASDCRLATGAGISGTVGIGGITVTHFGTTGYPRRVECRGLHIDKIWSEDNTYYSDQDGIKIFHPAVVDADGPYEASCSIKGSEFRNCWGRSIKSQAYNLSVDDVYFYRNEGFDRGYGNAEVASQRGGGFFGKFRCFYDGHGPGVIVSSSFEQPAGDPLFTPPRWATTVDHVQAYLKDWALRQAVQTFPRDGYVGPVSLKRVDVHGECIELLEFLVNGNSNQCFVEQCSVGELTVHGTSGNRTMVRVRSSGADTPFAGKVTASGNIYRGSETAYVAEGSIAGTAATATVVAENNDGFAGNSPP